VAELQETTAEEILYSIVKHNEKHATSALKQNAPFTLTGTFDFQSSTLFRLFDAANLLGDPMKITYDGTQVQFVNHILHSANPPRKCHNDDEKASRTTFS
jgi:hypothetical protein